MKKILLFAFWLGFSSIAFSQTDHKTLEAQRYQQLLSTSTKTLVLNTTGYAFEAMKALTNEFSAWQEKVISINYDVTNNKITMIHYKLMDERELFEVLDKYNITKNSIISNH